jgi:hypothetical protein
MIILLNVAIMLHNSFTLKKSRAIAMTDQLNPITFTRFADWYSCRTQTTTAVPSRALFQCIEISHHNSSTLKGTIQRKFLI